MSTSSVAAEIRSFAFKTFLALLLLPAVTWGLAHHMQSSTDAEYGQSLSSSIAADASATEAQRAEATAFFHQHAVSEGCFGNDDERLASVGTQACEAFSPLWQFVVVERLALATMLGGIALMLLMAAMGRLAFSRREVSQASFMFGWRVLVIAGALEVLLQGTFLVWLSFWFTAWFFHIYIIKLIAIAGIVVGGAVLLAMASLFKRVPMHNAVQGELLDESAAPALWARVRDLAARVNTAPPAYIVAGIDANFFVTEQPLQVGERRTSGRALYVSIPLLRVLDQAEADSVLAHELGHFVGGDTASSAALGPQLAQYDAYTAQMAAGGATILAWFPLTLYRLIFEMALRRSSREREFAADQVSVRLVSAKAIAQALVKVAAYSSYRGRIERELFDSRAKHAGALGIGQRVANGLSAFSASEDFGRTMHAGTVPHPFDSHPPLAERIREAGHSLPEADYAAVVREPAADSWTDSIIDAEGIEGRLWSDFEQEFAAVHEMNLAYRYEPSTDEERELVLRFFPDLSIPMTKGGSFLITYAGMHLPANPELLMGWDRVSAMKFENGTFSDELVINHPNNPGSLFTRVKISFNEQGKKALAEALNKYWHRHKTMRSLASAEAMEAARAPA
jgi:Zn-dependent protease with chaperone function